jgi:predicted TIM-barrel fold metal-dependent hydrolase
MKSRLFLAALALALLGGLGAVRAQPMKPAPSDPEQVPIAWIDVHVHLVGGRGAEADYGGAAEVAVREMDRFGIATAVVMPPPQVDSQSPYDHGSFAPALRRHPGRFAFLAGGGVLNATIHRHADPATVTDAVKREFAMAAERLLDAGAAGFGEIAALHISAAAGHPYEYVPADHPLLLTLADVAAKRGVPIELHMDAVEGGAPPPQHLMAGASNPPTLPDTLGALPRLLAHNPRAVVIWAHAGSDPIGAMSAATLERLMDAHPNLHASLRIAGMKSPARNKVFAAPGALDPAWQALLARHADRFLIGSDAFFASPRLRGSGPGLLFAQQNEFRLRATLQFLALLPPAVAQRIARANAARIYRLALR